MTEIQVNTEELNCKQCKKKLTLLEYMINPVCHACCVKNHREVAGRKK